MPSEKISTITPVILCGGSGTRLWPLSRRTAPKQFMSLGEEPSLFQQALKRLDDNDIYGPPVILTNSDYRFQVAEQAHQIGVKLCGILLEPTARNTAPAIAAAAKYIQTLNQADLIHVLPSDHLIVDDEAFRSAIETAAKTAMNDYLVTFGIKPSEPATGYGYIKAGETLNSGAHRVAKFIEKPPIEKAKIMLSEGGHSWNSGMFLFKTDVFLRELQAFEPNIIKAVSTAVDEAVIDLDFVRLDPVSFDKSPNISIDYALFERTQKAAVIPAAIQWSDIGSWKSLWENRPADENGNVVSGSATFSESKNNMIVTESQHVALNGVSDLTVVATNDALLISTMERSEQVKDIVSLLKEDPDTRILTEEHKTIYRPWGGYTSILNGERYQVKRLFVAPGKKLSLQKHKYRSEHWVVVSGTAEVTLDEKLIILVENESVYIPLGAVHRLANNEEKLLEVIEVQSGSYLGEDDIIRIEDDFGRGRTY
ncbi:MAG: mannose-1-phosphate guanylyltransferase/mannose-6-phosphate isomerase [Hyphomicrobiales bacterium]